jgi:hypothetical protein
VIFIGVLGAYYLIIYHLVFPFTTQDNQFIIGIISSIFGNVVLNCGQILVKNKTKKKNE